MAVLGSVVVTMDRASNSVFFYTFTDKVNYTSGEMMELSLNIESNKEKNVTIEIHAIKNYKGNYVKNIKDVVELEEGVNSFVYTDMVPSCTGCSGISKGDHEVVFLVFEDDKILLNETKTITIL